MKRKQINWKLSKFLIDVKPVFTKMDDTLNLIELNVVNSYSEFSSQFFEKLLNARLCNIFFFVFTESTDEVDILWIIENQGPKT